MLEYAESVILMPSAKTRLVVTATRNIFPIAWHVFELLQVIEHKSALIIYSLNLSCFILGIYRASSKEGAGALNLHCYL